MPDYTLAPITPLGGESPRIDSFDGLTITENPGLALASLACRLGKEPEFATLFKHRFGFDMPVAGQMLGKGDFAVFSTGLEQWFVEANIGQHESLASDLAQHFGPSASVTEQNDAWARFDVRGLAAPKVFERLCALDVAVMTAGSASRSTIEHLGVYVLCREAGENYSVLGPWSSAHSLHHALVTTTKSAV